MVLRRLQLVNPLVSLVSRLSTLVVKDKLYSPFDHSAESQKQQIFNYTLFSSFCLLADILLAILWSSWPSVRGFQTIIEFGALGSLTIAFLRLDRPIWVRLAGVVSLIATVWSLTSFKLVDLHTQFILVTTVIMSAGGYMFDGAVVSIATLAFSIAAIIFLELKHSATVIHFLIWQATIAIANDVTITARTKVINQAFDHRSAILARVSHDLRTPLNGIMGGISLLMRSQIERNFHDKRMLNIVHSSANQMFTLINDILDMSKHIASGQLPLNPVPCNVVKIVKEALGIIVPLAIEKKLEMYLSVQDQPPVLCSDASGGGFLSSAETRMEAVLSSKLEDPENPNIPRLVMADRTRLLQLMSNLLTNSLKFTEKGYIRTSVWFERKKGRSNWQVTITVKDSGIGLSEEQLFHIEALQHRETILSMNRSVPVSSVSTSVSSSGWGLGLQIVHHIVAQMGGKMFAESDGPGSGAAFKISFPVTESTAVLSPSDQLEPSMSLDTEYEPSLDLTGCQILVADDDLVNQIIISQILKRIFRCNVDVAQNGKEAVEKVEANGQSYSAILMDMLMPVMGGDEAAIKIRAMGWTKPIVAVSANLRAESGTDDTELLFDGYIEKPICIPRLGACLERLLPQFVRGKSNNNV